MLRRPTKFDARYIADCRKCAATIGAHSTSADAAITAIRALGWEWYARPKSAAACEWACPACRPADVSGVQLVSTTQIPERGK